MMNKTVIMGLIFTVLIIGLTILLIKFCIEAADLPVPDSGKDGILTTRIKKYVC